MNQQDMDPLQIFEHCIIKEEFIVPDTENEDEEGDSYYGNSEGFFDSNSNDKKVVPTLRKVRKSRTKTRTPTGKKSKRKVTSNGYGLVVMIEPDADTAMKNWTKSYCSSCNKKTKVISRKARCTQCSTALLYICENCDKTYKSHTSLRDHLKAIHVPVTSPLKCNKCNRVFIHQSNLLAHQKICGREPTFFCAECPHRAHYKSNLRQHITEKHSGRVFDCKACKKVFSNQRSLNRHVKCYCGKKRSLQCNHCRRKFFRKDHIIGHLQRVHAEVYGGKIAKRTCKYCNKALKTFEHRRNHLKKCKLAPASVLISADQPDLDAAVKNLAKAYCGDCKKKREIIRGKNICDRCQTQLTYTCKRCGLSWPSWSCLRQHLVYTHIVS